MPPISQVFIATDPLQELGHQSCYLLVQGLRPGPLDDCPRLQPVVIVTLWHNEYNFKVDAERYLSQTPNNLVVKSTPIGSK